MFWFLQPADGKTVDGHTVSRMWTATKAIWTTMLEKYKMLALSWMNISPTQQMEFYLQIEAKFPFLQLCEDHYKAQKIGTIDYPHFYKNHVTGKATNNCKAGKKRHHSKVESDVEDTMNNPPSPHKHMRRTLTSSLSQ